MNRRYLLALVSSVVFATSTIGEAATEETPTKLTVLEEAAWSAYKSTDAAYQADRADVEDLYRWSVRVRNAELAAGRPKAAEGHFERMSELHKKIAALHNFGAAGGSSVRFYASKYFMLKAQSGIAKLPAVDSAGE
jgi:hypothetical protein